MKTEHYDCWVITLDKNPLPESISKTKKACIALYFKDFQQAWEKWQAHGFDCVNINLSINQLQPGE